MDLDFNFVWIKYNVYIYKNLNRTIRKELLHGNIFFDKIILSL